MNKDISQQGCHERAPTGGTHKLMSYSSVPLLNAFSAQRLKTLQPKRRITRMISRITPIFAFSGEICESPLPSQSQLVGTDDAVHQRFEQRVQRDLALLNISTDISNHGCDFSLSDDSALTLAHYRTWSSSSSYRSTDVIKADVESGIVLLEEDYMPPTASRTTDFTVKIPLEISQAIFCMLEPKDLLSCLTVSRQWNSIIDSDHVWRKLYYKNGWLRKTSTPISDDFSWKKLFRTRQLLEKRWIHGHAKAKVLTGHQDSVYCVAIREPYIVTGSRDRSLKVWDSRSGSLLQTLNAETCKISHERSVLCVAIHKDYMVTGSSDSSCIIWHFPQMKPFRRVFRQTGPVLALSADDEYIVSCSRDSTISVWGWDANFSLKHRIVGHRGPVNAIHISQGRLFSAGGDSLVRMWDLDTGSCIKTFQGHLRGLACLHVTPCGKYVVSGGNDQAIRIWDIESGSCVGTLEGHKCLVRSLHTFGGKIISGSYDRTINIWDLKTKKLLTSLVGWHGSWIFSAKADAFKIVSTSFGKKPVILDFSSGLDASMLAHIEG